MNKPWTKAIDGCGKRFWHICDVADVKPILGNGLRGGLNPRNRGEKHTEATIYALSHHIENLMKMVLTRQIHVYEKITDFAVIEINRTGITGKIHPDHCGEQTDCFQVQIVQDVIDPKFLKLERIEKFDFDGEATLEKLRAQTAALSASAKGGNAKAVTRTTKRGRKVTGQ
jgi:hypothetical protein